MRTRATAAGGTADNRTGLEWSGMYKASGVSLMVSGILYFAGLAALSTFATGLPTTLSAEVPYIARNATPFEVAYLSTALAAALYVPAIIGFYFALGNTNKTYAAIGVGLSAIAIPIYLVGLSLGLTVVGLGNSYASATDTATRTAFLSAGIANLSGGLMTELLGNYVTAVSSIMIGLVMLRAPSFGRASGYLAVAAGIVSFLPSLVSPLFLVVETLLYAVWFVLVGWKLFRLREY